MKRRFGAVLAGLCVLGATGSAFAQDGKLKLGLRLGYAVPAGNIYGATQYNASTFSEALKVSALVTDQIPVGVDAGYMVTPELLVGAYGQYGFETHSPNNCSGCSAHDLHLGVQVQYHPIPDRIIDPWLGVGVGYESLKVSEGAPSSTWRGWELANLQGGLDFRTSRSLTLGPFASVAFDEYTHVSDVGGGGSRSVSPKAIHEWITIGVKGTFGI